MVFLGIGVTLAIIALIPFTRSEIVTDIIGVASILVLFCALLVQILSNDEQKRVSIDEQFKSTFFNLLQTQREIIEKISGNFWYLDYAFKRRPQDVRGLIFFKSAKLQLSFIFEALDNKTFHKGYSDEWVSYNEQVFHGGDYIPEEIEKGQEERKKTFRVAHTNDIYQISKEWHTQYKEMSMERKIGLGYAYFFNQYECIGYYFRHMYRILKFIRDSEKARIALAGKNISQSNKEEIHKQFKEYAQFIQAQMSIDELLLLFYNSFTFDKMQKLIVHYNLLENLTIQNLIKGEHNCKPELNLKDKEDLLVNLIKQTETNRQIKNKTVKL